MRHDCGEPSFRGREAEKEPQKRRQDYPKTKKGSGPILSKVLQDRFIFL